MRNGALTARIERMNADSFWIELNQSAFIRPNPPSRRSGKYAGTIDTSSMEAFTKSI